MLSMISTNDISHFIREFIYDHSDFMSKEIISERETSSLGQYRIRNQTLGSQIPPLTLVLAYSLLYSLNKRNVQI